jgi:hypothetical protein
VRARVHVVGWISSRWDRRQVPIASTAPYRYRRVWQFLPPMTLEYPNSASEYPQHPCSADLARRSLSAGPSMSHTSIRWPCTNVATSHVAFRIQRFRHVESLQHRELLTVQRNWRRRLFGCGRTAVVSRTNGRLNESASALAWLSRRAADLLFAAVRVVLSSAQRKGESEAADRIGTPQ